MRTGRYWLADRSSAVSANVVRNSLNLLAAGDHITIKSPYIPEAATPETVAAFATANGDEAPSRETTVR